MADTYGRTFREAAEAWLRENRSRVAATTYDRYADALERDIYPEYGDTPVKDVTKEEIERFTVKAPELAKERGRTLRNSALQVVRTVMNHVIQFADEAGTGGRPDIFSGVNPYEELTIAEMEQVCLRAKHNHCPEMLAALLSLFCGMRTGELCGLSSDDVDLGRQELYIHSTVHRVKNPDREGGKKTVIVVEELPRKQHIRRVPFPAALKGYIGEFLLPGGMLVRNRDGSWPVDPRTLENRLDKVFEAFRMGNVRFERLRKTYMNGKADGRILENAFSGVKTGLPHGPLDAKWLTDEMARDLAPLRMLVGLSPDEMGNILGVPEGVYRSMEAGRCGISWDQYLALLFLFHYNGRTVGVVDTIGLFPDALKENLKIGG